MEVVALVGDADVDQRRSRCHRSVAGEMADMGLLLLSQPIEGRSAVVRAHPRGFGYLLNTASWTRLPWWRRLPLSGTAGRSWTLMSSPPSSAERRWVRNRGRTSPPLPADSVARRRSEARPRVETPKPGTSDRL